MKLNEQQITQYLQFTPEGFHLARLQDQRSALHKVAAQLIPGLSSAPAETWLEAAAIARLQAAVERRLDSDVMADEYLEFANDAEKRAYRLLTGNNGQVMKHLAHLASQDR